MNNTFLVIDSTFENNFVTVHIVSVIPVHVYDISSIRLYILPLSGDVEKKPDPKPTLGQQCRILYANILVLYDNLNDLIAASRQYDILFWSEVLASGKRRF